LTKRKSGWSSKNDAPIAPARAFPVTAWKATQATSAVATVSQGRIVVCRMRTETPVTSARVARRVG
jgi:hypothetical protein